MPASHPWEHVPGEDALILRRQGTLIVALGVILMLAGAMAIVSSFLATVATVVFIGTVLVVTGVVHGIHAVVRRRQHLLGGLFLGILSAVVGVLLLARPVVAAASLTLAIAVLFLGAGIVRVVAASVLRHPQWGWSVINGIVTAMLGLIIFAQWPATTLWVIGTLVGVELLVSGGFMIATVASARRAALALGAKARSHERPREEAPPPMH